MGRAEETMEAKREKPGSQKRTDSETERFWCEPAEDRAAEFDEK